MNTKLEAAQQALGEMTICYVNLKHEHTELMTRFGAKCAAVNELQKHATKVADLEEQIIQMKRMREGYIPVIIREQVVNGHRLQCHEMDTLVQCVRDAIMDGVL